MQRRRSQQVSVAAAAGLLVAVLLGCADDEPTARQDAVAERGAEVMPFDLDATTHDFRPFDDGLVETVVADDPSDADEIGLIRVHLTEESQRFQRGDDADPAAIHGEDMPGLVDLAAGADAIDVDYEDRPDGARLTFTTDDPQLIDALHRWGEAQTTDHGEHE